MADTVTVRSALLHPLSLSLANDHDERQIVIKPGLNPGVDAEFFAAWLDENKQYSPVRRHMVSAVIVRRRPEPRSYPMAGVEDVKAEAAPKPVTAPYVTNTQARGNR